MSVSGSTCARPLDTSPIADVRSPVSAPRRVAVDPVAKGIATEQRQYADSFYQDDREVGRARHVVARTLRAWGMEADVPALELLTSELMSNAVVHGEGPILLRLSSDGAWLRLEVTDSGRGRPRLVGARPFGGWGLRFVDQLADSWGTEERNDGKTAGRRARRSFRNDPKCAQGDDRTGGAEGRLVDLDPAPTASTPTETSAERDQRSNPHAGADSMSAAGSPTVSSSAVTSTTAPGPGLRPGSPVASHRSSPARTASP